MNCTDVLIEIAAFSHVFHVCSYEARCLPKVSVATNLDARRFDASRTPQLPPQIATKLQAARGGGGGGANASRAQSMTGTTGAAFSASLDADNGSANGAGETWAADFAAGFVDLRQVCLHACQLCLSLLRCYIFHFH